MSRLFKVLLTESKVPACWKVAKLSPIHKKGEVLEPGTYRMIAVSGVMYRVYANVLKNLVTDWCVKKGKIPDTQFGFFSRQEHSASSVYFEGPQTCCKKIEATEFFQVARCFY